MTPRRVEYSKLRQVRVGLAQSAARPVGPAEESVPRAAVRSRPARLRTRQTVTHMVKIALMALGLAADTAGLAFAGPLEDAKAAFDGGDYAAAFGLWQPLADQGSADAQDGLGRLFFSGRGVAEDDVAAVQWLSRAANQGATRAQVLLGFMYGGGLGVAKDDAEAARWFAKAAEQGDLVGETNLANDYYYGQGVRRDFAEAARWYRKLA